jgi:hypothetical protein
MAGHDAEQPSSTAESSSADSSAQLSATSKLPAGLLDGLPDSIDSSSAHKVDTPDPYSPDEPCSSGCSKAVVRQHCAAILAIIITPFIDALFEADKGAVLGLLASSRALQEQCWSKQASFFFFGNFCTALTKSKIDIETRASTYFTARSEACNAGARVVLTQCGPASECNGQTCTRYPESQFPAWSWQRRT